MSNNIIKVSNLKFAYNNKFVLNNISFEVCKGDFFIISGQNGSGKSTLLKLITGILKPTSGGVFCGEKISYVSQKASSFNLDFPVNVYEIIASVLYNPRKLFSFKSREYIQEKVSFYLEKVGLSGKEKSMIGKLSGGQQQKVFIARALAEARPVIILDEPTVGIDYKSVKDICKLLQELNQEGYTIVIVTHDISSIYQYANKNLHIDNNGRASIEILK